MSDIEQIVDGIFQTKAKIDEIVMKMEKSVADTYAQYSKIFPGEYTYKGDTGQVSVSYGKEKDFSKVAISYSYSQDHSSHTIKIILGNEDLANTVQFMNEDTKKAYYSALKSINEMMVSSVKHEETRVKKMAELYI